MRRIMTYETLKWVGGTGGYLELLDQRKLPHKAEYVRCRTVEQLREAIRTLTVRGAPAIGVSAAYGFVLALYDLAAEKNISKAREAIGLAADYLQKSRPTAVNLFHAIERMKASAAAICDSAGATMESLREGLLAEAEAIRLEDVAMCRQIGHNGEPLIKDGSAILTHCNAGALATAGIGTALAPMFEAKRAGKRFTVYVDETRPLLQGARLTAWELMQAGIEVVLICDNMAGWLMKQKKVSAVFTGADRIAANGDAANKIGTYSLSVLAKANGVPFYTVAPSTTFDLSIQSGASITIEERGAEEVTLIGGTLVAPEGVRVFNPAFDVTDAANITAIVTEKGIIENPSVAGIAAHLKM
jgi:methylthioribose-1-phosphate isomerase